MLLNRRSSESRAKAATRPTIRPEQQAEQRVAASACGEIGAAGTLAGRWMLTGCDGARKLLQPRDLVEPQQPQLTHAGLVLELAEHLLL